jgi:Ca2+-binding EF-hand superfamily protein
MSVGLLVGGALCALAFVARAQAPAGYDVSAAFAQTDTNEDGRVEIDEFYERLVETYFHADSDKDGKLSQEEFTKAVVIQEDFAKIDVDSNGTLSRGEFIRSRLPLFDASDRDRDGGLSLDEVKAALEKEP